MYLLDTDHLSLLQRGGAEAQRLLSRLSQTASGETAVTIISYEEQTRGWFSYLARARSLEAQIKAYQLLKKHLQNYCAIPIIDFDEKAAQIFQRLQRERLKSGTMDLKIAAVALANDATLLTRNRADFDLISDLRVEDWTS